MSFVIVILGMIGLFVGFFAAGATFISLRNGEWAAAVVSGFILAVCATIFIAIPKPKGRGIEVSTCYTDWDGRSNPTVCE